MFEVTVRHIASALCKLGFDIFFRNDGNVNKRTWLKVKVDLCNGLSALYVT